MNVFCIVLLFVSLICRGNGLVLMCGIEISFFIDCFWCMLVFFLFLFLFFCLIIVLVLVVFKICELFLVVLDFEVNVLVFVEVLLLEFCLLWDLIFEGLVFWIGCVIGLIGLLVIMVCFLWFVIFIFIDDFLFWLVGIIFCLGVMEFVIVLEFDCIGVFLFV